MNRRRESSKARRQESPDQTLDRLIEMERRMTGGDGCQCPGANPSSLEMLPSRVGV